MKWFVYHTKHYPLSLWLMSNFFQLRTWFWKNCFVYSKMSDVPQTLISWDLFKFALYSVYSTLNINTATIYNSLFLISSSSFSHLILHGFSFVIMLTSTCLTSVLCAPMLSSIFLTISAHFNCRSLERSLPIQDRWCRTSLWSTHRAGREGSQRFTP